MVPFLRFRIQRLEVITHCKKLKVDLTQENVISVALWFHLGPGQEVRQDHVILGGCSFLI